MALTALGRIAIRVRSELKSLGYTLEPTSRSGDSTSRYIRYYHPDDPHCREHEIRIADHQLPFCRTFDYEILDDGEGETATKVAEVVAQLREDVEEYR